MHYIQSINLSRSYEQRAQFPGRFCMFSDSELKCMSRENDNKTIGSPGICGFRYSITARVLASARAFWFSTQDVIARSRKYAPDYFTGEKVVVEACRMMQFSVTVNSTCQMELPWSKCRASSLRAPALAYFQACCFHIQSWIAESGWSATSLQPRSRCRISDSQERA